MSLDAFLTRWQQDPEISSNVSAWVRTPARKAELSAFPASLDGRLVQSLNSDGITQLYAHQALAYDLLAEGKNLVVSTGTASGKTLCYDLPVLNTLLKTAGSTALYLFPTKALAYDQIHHIEALLQPSASGADVNVAVYDGDTPGNHRSEIRTKASLIITNPDMLHQGILPHHTIWKRFISGLRYVVIDEMHIYRGVFGSHIANVLRRLKRIAAFYGAFPQFVLTSATIGNAKELAENLIEMPVELIEKDGAPHGEKHFLIYNPPLVDEQLGIRKSVLQICINFGRQILANGQQALIFARTRRTVEMILKQLHESLPIQERSLVRGYRSGYLKSVRRETEQGFKNGDLRLVVATSALELGIDIGDLETVLIAGYPGSVARTLQQAGRAGRKQQTALSVLLAAPDAMDQYLAHHPEYLTDRNPENALIDPDNLSILLQHLRCAAFELPFEEGEAFGKVPLSLLKGLLELLVQNGLLMKQGRRYFWVADQYPSGKVSLRSSTTEVITLKSVTGSGEKIIGEIDAGSAPRLVHPGAIYLHDGESYYVNSLNLEDGVCQLTPEQPEYYTIPSMDTSIESYSAHVHEDFLDWSRTFGDLSLLMQITGYRKHRWRTNEIVGEGVVNLPPRHLETTGFWIGFSGQMIDNLRTDGLWLSDPNDYGSIWPKLRQRILARDGYTCRGCGAKPDPSQLHIHHIKPFKTFQDPVMANAPSNLVTLCHSCHQQAEISVRVRSGLAGAGYALRNQAPLIIMCDLEDISLLTELKSVLNDSKPAICVYDNIPGGLGLSQRLYENYAQWIRGAMQMIAECPCQDGCPACVGPIGEEGFGGKAHALALLRGLHV